MFRGGGKGRVAMAEKGKKRRGEQLAGRMGGLGSVACLKEEGKGGGKGNHWWTWDLEKGEIGSRCRKK